MALAFQAWIVLVVCVLSCATDSMAASVGVSAIEQAEQRLDELAKIISNIKSVVRPRHCNDILRLGQRSSGLYTIFPLVSEPRGQNVYCDMDTDGGGWTVIQRRGQFGNNVYYFYRNWTEYATGFGEPDKEYWIGNKALHALTSSPKEAELRLVLTNGTGETVSLRYGNFCVGSEEELFRLKVGKYDGPEGWDSFRYDHGAAFSTYDRDNDRDSRHCAVTFRGAWWYNRCYETNLNGLNLNGYHASVGDGIEWGSRNYSSGLHHYSYPRAVMMIRTE